MALKGAIRYAPPIQESKNITLITCLPRFVIQSTFVGQERDWGLHGLQDSYGLFNIVPSSLMFLDCLFVNVIKAGDP